MYRITSLVVLCLFALTEAKITTCDAPLGHVDAKDVDITGCKFDHTECQLVSGTNVTIKFPFTSKTRVEKVTAVVHGRVMNVSARFPFSDADTCKKTSKSGIHCPLLPGKSNYTATLVILKSYPKIAVEVQWELQDESGKDIACIKIPARIK